MSLYLNYFTQLNMYANIKILTNGVAYTTDWDSADGIDLKEYIKDTCYGMVNIGQKAVVNVEVMELAEPERIYGSNLPDGETVDCSVIKNIDNLVFIYTDTKESLELVGSNYMFK